MSKEQRANHQAFKKHLDVAELEARYYKAEFETMFYALKAQEIRPEFLKLREIQSAGTTQGNMHSVPEGTENEVKSTISTGENPFEASIEEQLAYADTNNNL